MLLNNASYSSVPSVTSAILSSLNRAEARVSPAVNALISQASLTTHGAQCILFVFSKKPQLKIG